MLLLHSPVGLLLVEYSVEGVGAVRYWRQGDHPPAPTRDAPAAGDQLGRQVVTELREYFAGERREFELRLAPRGTPFQMRVWESLRRIPYGETRTYAEVARELGAPRATRAVGGANRANALPILIPCHRVVAAGGGMGGYLGAAAGAGVEAKRWLLAHEGSREL